MSDTKNDLLEEKTTNKRLSRKKFLKYAGTSTATLFTLGLISCDDSNMVGMNGRSDGRGKPDGLPGGKPDGRGRSERINLGSGDVGILNFAYLLEQLEAAFYITVLDSTYSGMNSEEGVLLEDLRDHEVAHRDWLKAAITSVAPNDVIPELSFNFKTVDFSSRSSVLSRAQAFEDLGVSAYNGAAQLIDNTDFLVQAGKIVSVEARHAAAIRSIIGKSNISFAGDDIIDENGLEMTRNPNSVIGIARRFVSENIDASNLPKS